LLALFTHNNVFWVAALILALLKFPDFLTPINSISDSLKKLTAQEGSPSPNDSVRSEEGQ